MLKISTLATAALVTLAAGVTGAAAQPTLQDQQQAACYGDVQRLCGQFLPDTEKVTACMKPKKDQVSAKCRALWDAK